MIMRVGGRFPYLHEPESVFAAQGTGERRVCGNVCISSLYLSVCVHVCGQRGVETFDGSVDAESKHNNNQFHRAMLVQ